MALREAQEINHQMRDTHISMKVGEHSVESPNVSEYDHNDSRMLGQRKSKYYVVPTGPDAFQSKLESIRSDITTP